MTVWTVHYADSVGGFDGMRSLVGERGAGSEVLKKALRLPHAGPFALLSNALHLNKAVLHVLC